MHRALFPGKAAARRRFLHFNNYPNLSADTPVPKAFRPQRVSLFFSRGSEPGAAPLLSKRVVYSGGSAQP